MITNAVSLLFLTLPMKCRLESSLRLVYEQVLGGIADTVAQSLTAIRSRQRRPLLGNAISDGIEMPDYDEKGAFNADFLSPRRHGPPPFDFERLTRFMSYGFLMSPLQFHWYAFLARSFQITKDSATIPALQRVCFDQFIFAPIGMDNVYDFLMQILIEV